MFSAGVFCDLAYRGGRAAARFGLLEALRFKLRHPCRALAYLGLAVTPAPYVLHARVMRRFHPRRDVATPRLVEAWMRAAVEARGFEFVRPGVVAVRLRARDPARLGQAFTDDDPDAAYYLERNPSWADHEALVVWVPLDLVNVLASLPRAMRAA
ncbi:hypothetical protein ACNOYE_10215 [Nannocystaceae bacterium ST9]